jgi:hypothetical protein
MEILLGAASRDCPAAAAAAIAATAGLLPNDDGLDKLFPVAVGFDSV